MNFEDMTDEQKAEYTDTLRKQAESYGLKVHHKANADTIAQMIALYQEEQEKEKTKESVTTAETPQAKKLAAIRAATKLVRVRITSRNPHKQDYEGEIFSAGNSFVPTVKRFVPYDTDWHVEQILLNTIREKMFQQFYSEKNAKGQTVRRSRRVKEYVIEVLPPLTPAELNELKERQLAQRSIDE